MIELWPGQPYPLGATYDGAGTNFALFSEVAERVELCLFDEEDKESRFTSPRRRIRLARLPARCRPGPALRLPGARAVRPPEGQRCNPAKLLLDPYAKAIERRDRRGTRRVFGYQLRPSPTRRNDADSAAVHADASWSINPFFDWGDDRPPRTPYHRHGDLRGPRQGPDHAATRTCPRRSAAPTPGSPTRRSSSTSPPSGVTAVELMPVHQFVHDDHLRRRGACATTGATTPSASSRRTTPTRSPGGRGEQVHEFKAMVKALHAAGIEVILDVVYNHTAEGNHLGPTLCFRGIDNAAYYRLVDDDRRYYFDTTGTGNSLLHAQPARAAADHGLAAVLGHRDARRRLPVRPGRHPGPPVPRGRPAVAPSSTWSSRTRSSRQVKLIAEPWDIGEGGYQVGNFPPLWTEWNGKYRDTVRDFWRGEDADAGRVRLPAHRLQRPLPGRRPPPARQHQLRHLPRRLHPARPRLLQRQAQRGQRRGQPRRRDDNRSWNCGVEGQTDDPDDPGAARAASSATSSPRCCSPRACRCCSHGDEIGRTQHGNNNAYCQDNELSWVDWDDSRRDLLLLDFTRRLVALRARPPGLPPAPVLPRAAGARPDGPSATSPGSPPTGEEMTDEDWHGGYAKSLAVFLNGDAITEPDRAGRAHHRRLLPDPVQRPPRGRPVHRAGRARRQQWQVGGGHQPGEHCRPRAPRGPATACGWSDRSCWCCSACGCPFTAGLTPVHPADAAGSLTAPDTAGMS